MSASTRPGNRAAELDPVHADVPPCLTSKQEAVSGEADPPCEEEKVEAGDADPPFEEEKVDYGDDEEDIRDTAEEGEIISQAATMDSRAEEVHLEETENPVEVSSPNPYDFA